MVNSWPFETFTNFAAPGFSFSAVNKEVGLLYCTRFRKVTTVRLTYLPLFMEAYLSYSHISRLLQVGPWSVHYSNIVHFTTYHKTNQKKNKKNTENQMKNILIAFNFLQNITSSIFQTVGFQHAQDGNNPELSWYCILLKTNWRRTGHDELARTDIFSPQFIHIPLWQTIKLHFFDLFISSKLSMLWKNNHCWWSRKRLPIIVVLYIKDVYYRVKRSHR